MTGVQTCALPISVPISGQPGNRHGETPPPGSWVAFGGLPNMIAMRRSRYDPSLDVGPYDNYEPSFDERDVVQPCDNCGAPFSEWEKDFHWGCPDCGAKQIIKSKAEAVPGGTR